MKLCSKQVLSWLPETLHCKKVVVDQASNPPPRSPVSVLLSPQSSSKLLPHHHSPPRCFRRVSPSITVWFRASTSPLLHQPIVSVSPSVTRMTSGVPTGSLARFRGVPTDHMHVQVVTIVQQQAQLFYNCYTFVSPFLFGIHVNQFLKQEFSSFEKEEVL
ncbi:hypothetical protein E5676_scaffold456G00050 [Cucumis melo var. makuwa]|uniref:Uncharacterized protein n=1 Tax=Cucumis melo var. makuwa TaxID=1194695 RepID=A0A5D3D421_CUCMM|nr:hypothetical protein E5676_scaffold456G00050 [Cucumis melo var. makuwa]